MTGSVTKSGFNTAKEAKKALREKLSQLEKDLAYGVSPDTDHLTVENYLRNWIEKAKPNLTYKTYTEYKKVVNNVLIPELGHLTLKQLSPLQIENLYHKKKQENNLSSTTLRNYHTILSKALNQAVKWHLISLNPIVAVEKPRLAKTEMKVYDDLQVKTLLQALKGKSAYYPVLIAVTTGLRVGEIAGLRWTDIENDTIYVTQQLQKGENGLELIPLKTKRSKRKIPLMDITKQALRELDMRYKESKLKGGEYFQDLGFILCNEDGSPYTPSYPSRNYTRTVKNYSTLINKQKKNLIQQYKLPYIRFHDFRHTHATLLLKQGVNPKIVAERLGHSSVVITLDRYSHVLPDMQEQAVEKLNILFQ